MSTVRFRLDQLPPSFREQVELKLATGRPQRAPRAPGATNVPARRKTRAERPCAQDTWLGASKTERRYYEAHLSDRRFCDVYEPLRLRLAPGTFYTPDFVFVRDGQVVAVEVKGSYRLGSASRAYTAFMCARDRYPWISFEWWEERKGGFVRKH